MRVQGYYRHPTIHTGSVVFVSEDDLWMVSAAGGSAVRLTANPGSQSGPRFSPDGTLLAFVSRDEGQRDVHVMDRAGGPSRRLTFFGAATTIVAGWRPSGDRIVVATDHRQPFPGWTHLWDVPVDGSAAVPLRLGPAFSVGFGRSGRGVVLGRNTFDPARWKRYRGGRAGTLWIDRTSSGTFRELVDLDGNVAFPLWVGRRIYFVSDHEGVGNLYSTTPTGRDLRRHTAHDEFYVRYPSTDGERIVYQCGGDLWVFDPTSDETRRLDVTIPSARPQRNRRFLPPGTFLETVDPHPAGHSLAVTARGDVFTLGAWEGPVHRLDPRTPHRLRLATWLPGGERLLAVTDESGEETLTVLPAAGGGTGTPLGLDLGRVRSIDPAPAGASRAAVTNHRHELVLVDLARGSRRVLHRSPHTWIGGTAWSPDGRWLAFAAAETRTTMSVFLHDTAARRTHRVSGAGAVDHSPVFDPAGRYLAFLSVRAFDPVPDAVFHDYGFPRATIPVVVPLGDGAPSPFDPAHRAPRAPGAPAPGSAAPESVTVDLPGIAGRAVAVPVPAGRYSGLLATSDRLLWLSWPLGPAGERPTARLEAWNLATDAAETVAEGVTAAALSLDRATLALVADRRVRLVPAGWKDDKSGKDAPGRESGWIDLGRIRLEVRPGEEWAQMLAEAWRLQRDHYWSPDMGGVDWRGVYERYAPLVDRLGSRAELSDLLWEMQGELGTSHAYELGGDYLPEPTWNQGLLGADVAWRRNGWRVERVPRGDSWDPARRSPLAAPGVGVGVGDRLLAVDGVPLDATTPPEALLVDRAGRPVELTVARGRNRPRTVTVTPLAGDAGLRYRDWVEANRALVAELSGGRAGYIHIPDMQAAGFAEFHRALRESVDADGLVVDVRFNRGGNVSQLLLEKLARPRLGYRVARWRDPVAFPPDAPAGPMVCVTNEHAGSDGDIFSHTFKMRGLGPLVGTRTWGGVVGIWPQHALVDGTVTTQPEFGTWFGDVGYAVENYGTDPDVEVVDTPEDYTAGVDRQLAAAVELLVGLIDAAPPRPSLDDRPPVRPPRIS